MTRTADSFYFALAAAVIAAAFAMVLCAPITSYADTATQAEATATEATTKATDAKTKKEETKVHSKLAEKYAAKLKVKDSNSDTDGNGFKIFEEVKFNEPDKKMF